MASTWTINTCPSSSALGDVSGGVGVGGGTSVGDEDGVCDALLSANNYRNDDESKNDTKNSNETAKIIAHNMANASINEAENANHLSTGSSQYMVGQFVDVESRTWPGINQPGGVGRIMFVSATGQYVSVRYSLDNRFEKEIDVKYVKPYDMASKSSLRDRSMLLGRCTRCGSLRTDCGSCDFVWDDPYQQERETAAPKRMSSRNRANSSSRTGQHDQNNRLQEKESVLITSTRDTIQDNVLDDTDSSEDSADQWLRENERRYQKFKRLKEKSRKMLYEEEHIDSSNMKLKQKKRKNQKAKLKNDKHKANKSTETKRNNDHLTRQDTSISGNSSSDEENITLYQLAKQCFRRRRMQEDLPNLKQIQNRRLKIVIDSSSDDSDINSTVCLSLPSTEADHIETLKSRKLPEMESNDSQDNNESESAFSTTPIANFDDNFGSPDLSPSLRQHEVLSLSSSSSSSSPSSTQQRLNEDQGDMDVDTDDNGGLEDGFIQPEGDAEKLPEDTVDRTATLQFAELGPFFDKTANELEWRCKVDAKIKVMHLENEYGKIVNNSLTSSTPPAMKMDAFNNKCQNLYEHLIHDLVRKRLDQCQAALKRLSNKRLFQKYKASLTNSSSSPGNLIKSFRQELEARDFRMDTLNTSVEELLRRVIHLEHKSVKKRSQFGYKVDDDDSNSSNDEQISDDGWTEPNPAESQARFADPLEEMDDLANKTSGFSDGQLDPHPYAMKKRKLKNNYKYRSKAMRQQYPHHEKKTRQSKNDNTTNAVHGLLDPSITINENGSKSMAKRSSFRKSVRSERTANPNEEKGFTNYEQNTTGPIQRTSDNLKSHFRANIENDETSHSLSDGPSIQKDDSSIDMNFSTDNKNQNSVFVLANSKDMEEDTSVSRNGRLNMSRRTPVVFASGSSKPAALPGRGKGIDHKSILGQTQRYPTDNNENIINSSNAQSVSTRSLKRRLNNQQRNQTDSVIDRQNSINLQRIIQSATVAEDACFLSLLEKPWQNSEPESLNISGTRSVADLCTNFTQNFPSRESKKILNEICKLLESESVSKMYAKNVFQAILSAFRKHGCRILQDIVLSDSKAIEAHVFLLATVLNLIKAQVNTYLTPHCGDIYLIFSPESCQTFVDFSLHQLVDTVLSIFHPSAWALKTALNPLEILPQFEPLRAALGHILFLLERVSQCIVRELECQQWRCVRGGELVFVSSVDPAEWEDFLTSGIKHSKNLNVRYKAFIKKMPMCEIEAYWNVLAYFAQINDAVQDTGVTRWNLVTKLVTDRALSKEVMSEKFPPSEEQVNAACTDIQKTTHLLVKGVMGSLPRKDEMLVDLIQRAVFLQGYVLLHDEASREKLFPAIVNRDLDESFLQRIWRESDGVNPLFNGFLGEVANSLGKVDVDLIWMNQPLCLPNSVLLQKSLGLLLSWAVHIPRHQSNRDRFFESAMKTLVKRFYSEYQVVAKDFEQNKDGDSFLEAFAAGLGASKSGHGKFRRGLFFLESAAYVSLFSGLSTAFSETTCATAFDLKKLCEETWALVADVILRNRQILIYSDGDQSETCDMFCGDSFHLHIASRSLTFLCLNGIGVATLQRNHATCIPMLHACSDAKEFNDQAFAFLLSCLLACLDCSCDSCHNVEVMASIVGCLAIVLKNFWSYLKKLPAKDATLLAKCIQRNLHFRMMSIFDRCFKMVTSKSCCDVQEEICLQSLLCFLRWTFKVAITVNGESETSVVTSPRVTNHAEDDEFGGIDDAVLANIDLNQLIVGQNYREQYKVIRFQPKMTHDLLLESLDNGKPSARYSLTETNSSQISSQGRRLVGEHSKFICSCLAHLVASDFSPASDSSSILNTNLLEFHDTDDKKYWQRVILNFAMELCTFGTSPKVLKFVRCNCEILTCVLVEELGRIKKLPSCNLEILSKQPNFKLRKTVAKLHSFASNLGRILFRPDASTLNDNNWLRVWNVDVDLLRTYKLKLYPSLEQECFDYIRFLRRVLHLAELQELSIDFEIVSKSMIFASSCNLVRVLDLYRVESDATTGASTSNFRKDELYEMVSCSTEIFISILSLLFRPRSNPSSDSWKGYLIWISDHFLLEILRSHSFDLRKELCRLANASSEPVPVHHEAYTSQPNVLNEVICCSLTNRIRNFFLFSMTCSRQDSFLNAFLSAIKRNDVAAAAISHAFSAQGYTYQGRQDQSSFSLLQSELNDYLSLVDESHPLELKYVRDLMELKQKAYGQIILSLSSLTDDNYRAISLLSCLLDSEHEEYTSISPKMSLENLCFIAKCVIVSLKACLASDKVDDNLINSLFSCAWSLANLPATFIDLEKDAVGFLIDWCYTVASLEGPEQSSSYILCSKYLWHVFCWLKDLGNLIFNGSCSEEVKSFRLALQGNMQGWGVKMPKQSVSTENLAELESEIFLKNRNSLKVTNKYAPKKVLPDSAFQPWTPSLTVRQCVVKLMSKISTASIFEF